MGPGARGAWLTPLAVGLLLAGAWVFGEYVRARRAYLAEFERRAVLVESERLALARVAVAEERARIAREIHDVLAHSVSVMVVNAEGGRLMRHVDPAVVDRTLGVISATGREALGELRRLLEVLRTPDADASADPDHHPDSDPRATPEPLSADLRRLIGRLDTSGTRARLDVRGEQRGLPADLTVPTVRVVQTLHEHRQARAAGRHDPRTGRHGHSGARAAGPRAGGELSRSRTRSGPQGAPSPGARPAALVRSRSHRHARTHRPVRRECRCRAHTRRRLPGRRHPARRRARAHRGGPMTGPTPIPASTPPPMSSPSRVLICDDQELIRMGLRMVVDSQPDLTVVGEAADGDAAIAGAAAWSRTSS